MQAAVEEPHLTLRAYGVDKSERRFRHHSSGEVLEEGFNGFLSASGTAFWGDWLGGAYEVQFCVVSSRQRGR